MMTNASPSGHNSANSERTRRTGRASRPPTSPGGDPSLPVDRDGTVQAGAGRGELSVTPPPLHSAALPKEQAHQSFLAWRSGCD